MQSKPHSISTFFNPPEHKSAKVHVVFYISENCFHFNTAQLAQGDALLGEQIGFYLLAIASQFKPDLHLAIALGLCAFGFERASGIGQAFNIIRG